MQNLMFNVGDAVVHPQYGVGQVVKMEDREFERGVSHRYYEVSLPGGAIIWVPVERADSVLRRVARKSEIALCRKILTSRPLPLTEDGRVRQSELVARLQHCTIAVQCEVVRDLSAFVSHKPSYGTISGFLEAIQGALYQEWSVIEEISVLEATVEIRSLLERPTQK